MTQCQGLLLLCVALNYVPTRTLSCMATTPAQSPTTTTTSTTKKTTTTTSTTTTTTTTTTKPPACRTCTLQEITLTAGNNVNSTTPTTSDIYVGADGCDQLTVTCTPLPGGTVFMQFNSIEGGPSTTSTGQIMATLICINGQWVYAPGNGLPSRVITEVNCQASSVGGR